MTSRWDRLNGSKPPREKTLMRRERAHPPATFHSTANLPLPLQDIESIPTDVFTVIPKGRAKKAAVETMMQAHLDRLRVAAQAQVKVDKAKADLEVKKHLEELHENYLDFIENLGVRQVRRIKEISWQYEEEFKDMIAGILDRDMPEFMRDIQLKFAQDAYVRRITELFRDSGEDAE